MTNLIVDSVIINHRVVLSGKVFQVQITKLRAQRINQSFTVNNCKQKIAVHQRCKALLVKVNIILQTISTALFRSPLNSNSISHPKKDTGN